MTNTITVMTHEEWKAEGERRFGPDPMKWKFICPSCGHVASVQDWKDAHAPQNAVAFSCVGRWAGASDANTFKRDGGPCQYAGGGLIGLNPVEVRHPDGSVTRAFDFAAE